MASLLITRIVLAVSLLAMAGSASSSTEVNEEKLLAVVNSMCQDKLTRIGRQSSIAWLTNYLSSDLLQQDMISCRDKYLEPLKDLQNVLEAGGDNVCNNEKVEAISRFHWNYIVGSLSWWWRKASDKSLPEPLKLFFLHYASEITERCKETLSDRLEAAAIGNTIKSESLFNSKFGGAIDQLSIALVTKEQVKNYDSFFFIWNQIIAKERKKGRRLVEFVDDLTREPVIVMMKVKEPQNAWAVQHQCRHELRPVYQHTVLPVMRLIELGYGKVDEQSGKVVEGNLLIGNWYAITQLCELLVPINFYRDDSLKVGEATILSNPDEAKGLGRPDDVVSIDKIDTSHISVKPMQLDDLMLEAGHDEIIDEVTSNFTSRSRLFAQFFKNIFNYVKDKLWSTMKGLFVSRKTDDNEQVEESAKDVMEESKDAIDELMVGDDDEHKSLGRTKRTAFLIDDRSIANYNYSLVIVGSIMIIVPILLGLLVMIG